MATPSQLGTGIQVNWTIPQEILSRSDIDVVRVFKSSNENSGYVAIANMAGSAGSTPTSYFDLSGSRNAFYLVSFIASATNWESNFHITFFRPLPREARLIEEVRRSVPAVLQSTLTDEDYLNGLKIAVQMFNVYPPQTYFTLQNFPESHRFFLTALAQMTSLASRYLTLSIRDFRYSEPGGVVMDIDRGAKINEALNIIAKVYTQMLPLVKLDFSDDLPMGLGTVQLPISMGGQIASGALNILDIFTATGR